MSKPFSKGLLPSTNMPCSVIEVRWRPVINVAAITGPLQSSDWLADFPRLDCQHSSIKTRLTLSSPCWVGVEQKGLRVSLYLHCWHLRCLASVWGCFSSNHAQISVHSFTCYFVILIAGLMPCLRNYGSSRRSVRTRSEISGMWSVFWEWWTEEITL